MNFKYRIINIKINKLKIIRNKDNENAKSLKMKIY